jgi:hypothetical protein
MTFFSPIVIFFSSVIYIKRGANIDYKPLLGLMVPPSAHTITVDDILHTAEHGIHDVYKDLCCCCCWICSVEDISFVLLDI